MATVTQRKAGWQVQVRRHGFKPLSKHFKTGANAKAWARTIEAEMGRGVLVDRSHAEQTTLPDILQRYRKTATPLKRGKNQEESRISVVLAHPVAARRLPRRSLRCRSSRRRTAGRQVAEEEINPLIVKPAGEGVVAVDGLIVFRDN